MSMKKVKEILDKAFTDPHFRDQLIADPDKTLKSYQLSEEIMGKFRNISKEKLTAYKSNIDQRYSKDGSAAFSDGDDWWVESVTD